LIDLPDSFWTSCSVASTDLTSELLKMGLMWTYFADGDRCGRDALVAIGFILKQQTHPSVVPQVRQWMLSDLHFVPGNRYLGGTIEIKNTIKGQVNEDFLEGGSWTSIRTAVP
jgi:hypothetical protein